MEDLKQSLPFSLELIMLGMMEIDRFSLCDKIALQWIKGWLSVLTETPQTLIPAASVTLNGQQSSACPDACASVTTNKINVINFINTVNSLIKA